jgi:hypothetical protein
MRLARTAAPLPRVALQGLAGRSRTCDLRRPKPAGWPLSPTTRRLVVRPVTLPGSWVASTKPEAVIARRQGDQPCQGRGRTLAQRDRGPGSMATLPVAPLEPPAGLEPAASGLRARRHQPFRPRGREELSRRSWSRTRPCSVSASRAAADTDLRKLGRQGSNLRFASNSRASYRSTTPERCSGRSESRTRNGRSRTRFRDGIPRQWQSFPKWPRQASNPHCAD